MVTQYDKISQKFKNADESVPDVTRPILYSLVTKKKGKLLDLGCGYGEDLVHFQKEDFEVYGIDVSKEMVKEAEKKSQGAKVSVSSFEKLPYDEETFDIIFSRYALQHSDKITPIFKEVSRVLKKGGEFVFLVTHPIRHYFEKKTKDYWKQEICSSLILGGKVRVEEPSHKLNEYINKEILSKFDLIDFIEEFDPAAEKIKDAGKYPSILILKFKKR
ncbi:MAG TPA: class I SAM-dependent methyltransferase [Candidatus Paceibacterota bacterium]|nr:MAG: putative methyltransferase YcgJ [Parcubacteria group bacterium ADurb.Bin115]HNU81236.1 class I SAM-dependent methyltransferase [bacterium]HPW34533.1 class I SAM-dependent methyltransferase [Candidatus Paceibacterota bacterium]